MHLFWRSTDQNYFSLNRKEEGEEERQVVNGKEMLVEEELGRDLATVWGRQGDRRQEDAVRLAGRMFTAAAFREARGPEDSAVSFKHYCLLLDAMLQCYKPLLLLAGRGRLPCEPCTANFIKVFMQHWSDYLDPGVDEGNRTEARKAHIQQLLPLSIKGLCQNCLFKIGINNKPKQPFIDTLQTLKTSNSNRLSELLKLSENRKNQRLLSRTNTRIFREIECQKSFIQRTLLELERKILAEAIYKVSYAKKNKKVEVLLTKPGLRLTFRTKELLELDDLRENSLFKLAKTSIKTHNSYFSYNVL